MPLALFCLTLSLVIVLFPPPRTGAQSAKEPQDYNCDFESQCGWTWNTSVAYGFRRIAGQEGQTLMDSDGVTAPVVDASNNSQGHFLFLNELDAVEELHVRSPRLASSIATCALEMYVHMANISTQSFGVFVDTAPMDGKKVTWIVTHVNGVNGTSTNGWELKTITIGQVTQNFTIVLAITKSPFLPAHIAIDNIRLVNCFPVPKLLSPADCRPNHFACNNGSCLEQWHVCDLVSDCPEGEDEKQSCDKVPPYTRCSFENGTCGWKIDDDRWRFDHKNCSSPSEYFTYSKEQTIKTPGIVFDGNGDFNNLSGISEQRQKISRGTCLVGLLKGPFTTFGRLESPIINPPPRYHGNEDSRYYNTCDIRFSYRQFGKTPPSLRLTVTEIGRRKNISHGLYWSYKDHGENWYQTRRFLPNVTQRYTVAFEFQTGRGTLGYIAIDDISMSPECFGLRVPENETEGYDYETAGQTLEEEEEPLETVKDFVNQLVYEFNSCGAVGMEGPTKTNCTSAYNNTGYSVDILDSPYLGVQRWIVPETEVYTIIARGASGGKQSGPNARSLASEVRSVLHLTKGQSLLFLVGQEGLAPFQSKLPSEKKSKDRANGNLSKGNVIEGTIRDRRPSESNISQSRPLENLRNGLLLNSLAGGGGGGTFVIQVNKASRFVPILVAAGGGGLGSTRTAKNEGVQHGHGANSSRDPIAGVGFGNTPAGPGGGWRVSNVSATQSGLSLLQGGQGGRACNESNAHGGFGGGGGGCRTGGGGGGYSGGNTWSKDGSHGEGGYSYVDKNGKFQDIQPAFHQGPGGVIVVPAVTGCQCEYRCVALNSRRSRVACICPPEWVLSPHDLKKCIEAGSTTVSIIIIVVLILMFMAFVGGSCLIGVYLYNRYQRSRERGIRRKNGNPDVQLERLRHASDSMMTEFNPNYEFAGTTYTIRDMREIPREQLSLVKALGQGAFGEVYQGFFRHRAGDAVEMPVAVKTLPELSTNQAENDFLTEALIMSKFNHPNIVHLIGVCFDKHPRFIVLELLAGGDLKTFLRESRPRQDILQKSVSLSMHDLLTCAMDVAKGCKYLEDNRFIHRDIAARNCLLTSKGPGRVVKIADFGMAREVYMSDYYRKGGKAMLPVKWMPPEAFLDGIFTSKTDVWSFGVLLWEVMSLGYMPYTGLSNREVMRLVAGGSRLEQPANCPLQVYAIMIQCWNPSQNERPSFGVILERLGYCMQDPEVLSTPMPVFNRPPSNECDSTVMRPSDDALALSGQQAIGIAEDYLIPNNNHNARKDVFNMPWLPGLTQDSNAIMPVISEEESAPWRVGYAANPSAYTSTTDRPPAVPAEYAPPAPDPASVRNGPVSLDVSALRNHKSGYVNVGVKDQTGSSIDGGVQPAGSVLPGSITC